MIAASAFWNVASGKRLYWVHAEATDVGNAHYGAVTTVLFTKDMQHLLTTGTDNASAAGSWAPMAANWSGRCTAAPATWASQPRRRWPAISSSRTTTSCASSTARPLEPRSVINSRRCGPIRAVRPHLAQRPLGRCRHRSGPQYARSACPSSPIAGRGRPADAHCRRAAATPVGTLPNLAARPVAIDDRPVAAGGGHRRRLHAARSGEGDLCRIPQRRPEDVPPAGQHRQQDPHLGAARARRS